MISVENTGDLFTCHDMRQNDQLTQKKFLQSSALRNRERPNIYIYMGALEYQQKKSHSVNYQNFKGSLNKLLW